MRLDSLNIYQGNSTFIIFIQLALPFPRSRCSHSVMATASANDHTSSFSQTIYKLGPVASALAQKS